MSKFITYEYDSGEIVFIRRADISSFRPVYTHPGKYRVFVTVGKETFVVQDCNTIEDAKDWIREQIAIIENPVASSASKKESKND